MKTKLLLFLLTLTIVGARGAKSQVAPSAEATNAPASSAPAKLSSEELEKLVMPIALHPDPLIAVILPASVYPLEIVQAARFVKDTNNIPKVDDQPWDDNVKELAKFPDMIAKMDADLAWTMRLGDAFLNQGKELMDTIQALRGKVGVETIFERSALERMIAAPPLHGADDADGRSQRAHGIAMRPHEARIGIDLQRRGEEIDE